MLSHIYLLYKELSPSLTLPHSMGEGGVGVTID